MDQVRAVTLAQVLQHQRRRQHLRYRVGHVLPGDIRRAAVYRLEVGVVVADVAGGQQAQPADGAAAEVAEDVAEEVLHDQHVEVPRPRDQRFGRGVSVQVLSLHVRVVRRDFVEHLAEEGERCQHVGLVDAGHARDAVAGRAVAFARQLESVARRRARCLCA